MVVDKDLNDIWDAIRSIRKDIDLLQKADQAINADFLKRSYDSIIERLEEMQKDIDTFKSR
jgi:uncharacterized protein YlzI (FlbEa/FlbD family)